MSWNIGDIFSAIGPVLGEEPALVHASADGTSRVLTWSEVDRRTNALARAFVDAGCRPGDKVAIYSYNRPEWLEAVAACMKARLVPVNVNYRYRDEELLYLLDNSDAVATRLGPKRFTLSRRFADLLVAPDGDDPRRDWRRCR